MKRAWFGLALLALLLLSSLGAQGLMDEAHLPMGEDLRQAAQAVQAGDWPQAKALCRQAEERWEQTRFPRSFLADHTPAEQIDAAFARLDTYTANQDAPAFAAAARELAEMTQAIAKAHDLAWENLF